MNDLAILKDNKVVLIVAVVACILTIIIWFQSPMYHNEMAYQRKQVVDFIRVNYWQMPQSDKESYMDRYGITEEELTEPLEKYLEKGN